MSTLKESWKETGTEFGHAFRDLGKTVIKTAKTGVDKVEDWAMDDDNQKQPSKNQNPSADNTQTENQQTMVQPAETKQTVSQPVESPQEEPQQAVNPQMETQQVVSPQTENQQSTASQNSNQQNSLKNDWKSTGVGLGHAFRDLGKTVIKSAKTGADKVEDWATRDDKPEK